MREAIKILRRELVFCARLGELMEELSSVLKERASGRDVSLIVKKLEQVLSEGAKLETERGVLYPFDTDNYRLSAENNSLVFDEEGDIVKVKTLRTGLKVSTETGIINIKACKAQDPLTGFERLFPLELRFDGGLVEVTCLDKIKECFPADAVEFI